MFSTLKHVSSPTLAKFRENWNAKYLGGFVVHNKAFDGLNGNFPIGFLVWETNQYAKIRNHIVQIETEVLDKNATPIGENLFFNTSDIPLLTDWIQRPKTNVHEVIPLKNVITPATSTKDLRGTKWSNNAIAFFWSKSNDMQHANQTALFSSGFGDGHGIFINGENLLARRRYFLSTPLNQTHLA